MFRRQAALVHEAATFITDAQRMFPEVATFVDGLESKARDGCERVIGAVDRGSAHTDAASTLPSTRETSVSSGFPKAL